MNGTLEIGARIAAIGIGATLVLDGWSLFLQRAFGVPFPSYPMVGRWVGHFAKLRFWHKSMAEVARIEGEGLIGWTTHYVIGVGYAAMLVAISGQAWLGSPTVLPALIIGIATVVAPLFIMQPAMGSGFASSKAQLPGLARLRSLAAHLTFGIGLFLSALTVSLV